MEDRQPTLVAALAPPAPAARSEAKPTAAAPAQILGRMTLKRNETLSQIIKRVYGDFSSASFQKFIRANPQIIDPDRVPVGQKITLPAIPTAVKPPDKPVWWVALLETDSHETAFNILRNEARGFPAVRLIPYWNPETGTRFTVVLNKLFTDESSARRQLAQLPAELASGGMIASLWNEHSIYYADPYLGRNL